MLKTSVGTAGCRRGGTTLPRPDDRSYVAVLSWTKSVSAARIAVVEPVAGVGVAGGHRSDSRLAARDGSGTRRGGVSEPSSFSRAEVGKRHRGIQGVGRGAIGGRPFFVPGSVGRVSGVTGCSGDAVRVSSSARSHSWAERDSEWGEPASVTWRPCALIVLSAQNRAPGHRGSDEHAGGDGRHSGMGARPDSVQKLVDACARRGSADAGVRMRPHCPTSVVQFA